MARVSVPLLRVASAPQRIRETIAPCLLAGAGNDSALLCLLCPSPSALFSIVLRGTTLRPPQCAVTTTWRAGRLPVAKTDGRNNGTVLPHRAVRHPPYFPVCQSVCSHRGVRQRAAAIIAGGYFRVRRVGRGGVPHPRHGRSARSARCTGRAVVQLNKRGVNPHRAARVLSPFCSCARAIPGRALHSAAVSRSGRRAY